MDISEVEKLKQKIKRMRIAHKEEVRAVIESAFIDKKSVVKKYKLQLNISKKQKLIIGIQSDELLEAKVSIDSLTAERSKLLRKKGK